MLSSRSIRALLIMGSFALLSCARAAEDPVVIPPPAVDEKPAGAATATAVFAGGCFWGVQAVFQHVNGVLKAVSGYAGGAASTATYEMTGRGGYRARGIGADHLRPEQGDLRQAAAGVLLRGARSHATEPPGSRSRHAISLDDFRGERASSAHSRSNTSRSSTVRRFIRRQSSRRSRTVRPSIRPRPITRTFWCATRTTRTS